MLRKLLLGFGLLLTLCGIGLVLAGLQPGFPPLVLGLLLLFGILLEQRYKPPVAAAKGQPTGERFVDPTTGELMEVWYDPATGERSYVRVGKR